MKFTPACFPAARFLFVPRVAIPSTVCVECVNNPRKIRLDCDYNLEILRRAGCIGMLRFARSAARFLSAEETFRRQET